MQLIETTSSSSSNSSSKSVFERQRRHHGKKITQQRFCVSQEDLNQALLRMHTRKKHHSKDIYQTPSASVEITKASSQEENSLPVSTLIKEFEQLGGNINSKKTTRIRTTFVSALDLVRRDSSDIPYTSADQTRSSSFSHETDLSMSSKQEPKQMDKPSAEEENRNIDDVEQISRQMLSIDTSLAEILNSVNQLNEISRNFEILAADNCSQTVEKYVPLEIHRQIFDNDNNTNNNVWSKINVCNNNYKHMSDVQEVIAVKDKSIIESSMSKTITTSSVCSTISSHSILLQPQLETVTLSSSSPSLVALTNNNNNKNITTTTTTLVPSNSVIEKIENDEEQLDRNNNNDKSIDKKRSAFSSTSSSTSNNKQQLLNDKINFDSDNDILTMLTTRSTDIDQVIAAQSKIRSTHHQNVNNNDQTILLKELLLKEKNLNYALSDLVAITGTKNDDNHSTIDLNKFRDNDIIRRSKSFDNQRIQTTIPKKKIQAIYDADVSSSNCSTSSLSIAIDRNNTNLSQTSSNDLSTSIAILNHLLDDLNIKPSDIGSETLSRKCSNQQRTNLFKCDVKPINMFCVMLSDKVCKNCNESFAENEQIVNAAGETWHSTCFVCAQCFQPFGNGIYFEYDNRKYCERDFQMLFAPCCAKCNRFIIGRVIRALQQSWHPDCFRCELCHKALIEMGFLKNAGRALCRDCHVKEKSKILSKLVCSKCHLSLDENCLKYKGESYHAYHFRCQVCSSELNENAREVRGELYCLRCYDQLEVAVCAACRTQIEDRVINALGKQWHVEHFACGRCEKPFLGSKHYEKNGIAYCETDYHHLFGNTCFVCNTIISGDVFTACNKTYCVDHFACMICETKMDEKSKFYDVDAKPVCKKCFNKLPSDVRKQIERKKKGNKN